MPYESKEYHKIDEWGVDIVEAAGLKSASEIDFDITKYFKFNRHKKWDCKQIAFDYYSAKSEYVHMMWNYYLILEEDLNNTSRYIEPKGQGNAYSFEFVKLLLLSCTEIESLFKTMCNKINGSNPGDISLYKQTILGRFPKITETEVYIYIYPVWKNLLLHLMVGMKNLYFGGMCIKK